ncbi:MAG TPA: histidinol-phosphatase [Polyangiales bacterium]|jgi:histidinol-phosphatase (PHP family)|nr:histidinol-phosphatase [Polyangiales bacterium]
MPWFSYHGGHSGEFCKHAKGGLEAVVQRAIEAGFSHYGLSEHVARFRNEDLFPEEIAQSVTPDSLLTTFDAYFAHARALQERYADRIDLLVGFETERLPPGDWATRMREARSRTRADYLVGSVHDIDGLVVDYKPEVTREVAEKLGGVEEMHVRYFDALAELVTELKPEVVGHIDLIRKFDGETPAFGKRAWTHLERTLEAVRAAGAVLDVNAATRRRGLGPVYPLPEILQRACAMGIGVTLGDDSHGAHDVGVGLDACMQAITAAGYREVSYLAHEDGRVVLKRASAGDVHPR